MQLSYGWAWLGKPTGSPSGASKNPKLNLHPGDPGVTVRTVDDPNGKLPPGAICQAEPSHGKTHQLVVGVFHRDRWGWTRLELGNWKSFFSSFGGWD